MKKRINSFLIPIIVPVVFIIIWSIASKLIDNKVILPSVAVVINNFSNATDDFIGLGSLPSNILVSLIRVLLGYTIGVIIALPVGVLMGYKPICNKLLNNFINIFRPIPPLAWVPLVLAWFGVSSLATLFGVTTGDAYATLSSFKLSMIFIIALGTFFPVVTSSIFAVQSVNRTLIDSAKVLGASQRDMFFKILIPAAAPTIINGLRTALGIAWACLVSAEMLPGSLSGMGYLITHAYELARTDLVITGMICIGAFGALLDFVFRIVEKKYFSWQNKAR
ncbi:MAG: ABC transporter permease [Clostridium sp.]